MTKSLLKNCRYDNVCSFACLTTDRDIFLLTQDELTTGDAVPSQASLNDSQLGASFVLKGFFTSLLYL